MDINIRTFFYLFAAIELLIIIYFAIYIYLHKVKSPSINIFIFSKFLFSFVFIIYALGSVIPEFHKTLFANFFFSFALFYELYSIAYANKVFNRKRFISLNTIPIFTSLLLIALFSASENIRAIVGSQVVTYYFLGGGLYLILKGSKIQHLIGYLCLVLSLLFLARTMAALIVDKTFGLYTNNIIQIISYISFILVSISVAKALHLIAKEQDGEKVKNVFDNEITK